MATASPSTTRMRDSLGSELRIEIQDGVNRRVESYGGARLTIGRAHDATLRLDHDTVSRRHAELLRDPFGRWWVRDLGSRNGTKVGDQRIEECLLTAGDRIRVGKFELVLGAGGIGAATPEVEPEVRPQIDEHTRIDSGSIDQELPPTVSAAILSSLTELNHGLNETPTRAHRLERLCEFLVGEEFRGQMAVVLRVSRGTPARPAFLCDPRAAEGTDVLGQHISHTLVDRVLREGCSMLGSNTGALDRQATLSISPEDTQIAAVACPLHADADGVDLLYVTFPPQCALREWLALTDLAAKEFQHAEKLWEVRGQVQLHAVIEQDLRRAQEIQRRLVPAKIVMEGLDIAVGLEPCRWVGGDYADVVPLPDGRVYLGVGDVSGKGLDAAMLCMSLHTLIRARLLAGGGLAELLDHVNELLPQYLPEASFVTLAAAMLRPEEEGGEYVNAGHLPGLIVDATGKLRELPWGVNFPLGLDTKPVTAHPLVLRPDEVMAMFTDGWTELHNAADEMLGLPRVGQCFRQAVERSQRASAANLMASVVVKMDKFRDRCMPGDDRTMLIARRA